MPKFDLSIPKVKCQVCGKMFRPPPHRWRTRGLKGVRYCNRQCRNNDVNRFWDQIKKDHKTGCWIWGNSKRRYHTMRLCGHYYRVHHLSWMIHRGNIPIDKQVLHKCDVTRCVNPDHLFLGTIQDNMADRQRKGRTAIGSKSSQAKLNEQIVAALKKRLAKMGARPFRRGELKALLIEFGIAANTLRSIQRGHTWKHV